MGLPTCGLGEELTISGRKKLAGYGKLHKQLRLEKSKQPKSSGSVQGVVAVSFEHSNEL